MSQFYLNARPMQFEGTSPADHGRRYDTSAYVIEDEPPTDVPAPPPEGVQLAQAKLAAEAKRELARRERARQRKAS